MLKIVFQRCPDGALFHGFLKCVSEQTFSVKRKKIRLNSKPNVVF